MAEPNSRVFYRVIESNRPTERDFMSNAALGRRPKRPLSALDQVRWGGISCYGSLEQARLAAGRSPWLGDYVAAIEITAEAPIQFEQTYHAAHWTLWGEPTELLARVVSVRAVREVH